VGAGAQQQRDDGFPTFEVAALVGGVTALLTGIGALSLTGTLGRVQRNHPTAFAIALGLVVVGVTLVALGAVLARRSERLSGFGTALWIAGALGTAAGVIVGFVVAVASAGQTERPSLDVRLDQERLTVTGTASVSDMSSRDSLEVRVYGLRDYDHELLTPAMQSVPLARMVVGPDGDGKATQNLDVRLPHGGYDAIGVTASVKDDTHPCGLRRDDNELSGGTACVNLPLPRRARRPTLVAAWGRHVTDGRVVVLKLSGMNLDAGSRPNHPLLVRAVGMHGRSVMHLYRAVIQPVDRGTTERTIRFAVPSTVRIVCAGTLRAGHRPLACPTDSTDVNSVELRALG
jgi:hypothetical protein